jgi:hypothetical protein
MPEPAVGIETAILCTLHDFGALNHAQLADAIGRGPQRTTHALERLAAKGLVLPVHGGWVSAGEWWPGEPSAIFPKRG